MEDGARWGRGRFLGMWVLLTAGQVGSLTLLSADDPVTAAAAVVAIAVLQGAKAWWSRPRLHDLGRPTEDAFRGLVPLLNLGLWRQLAFTPTPTEARRARRMRVLSRQTTMVGAYRRAAGLMVGQGMAVAVPTLLAGLAASAAVDLGSHALRDLATTAPGTAQTASLALLGFLGLYTALQILKRRRATLASWLPVLGLVPSMILALYTRLANASLQGMEALVTALPGLALSLVVQAVVGGWLAALWILHTHAQLSDDADAGAVGEQVRSRWRRIAVAYGARSQAATLGFQLLIIPGVLFSILWAFADVVAAVEPEASPFQRSRALATGMYSRLFNVLTVWAMATILGTAVAWLPLVEWRLIFVALFLNPHVVGLVPHLVGAVVAQGMAWWCVVAVTLLFHERRQVVDARAAREADGSGA